MSVNVFLGLHSEPEAAGAVDDGLGTTLHHTRGCEGVGAISVPLRQDDPCELVIVGRRATRAHGEAWLAWRTDVRG